MVKCAFKLPGWIIGTLKFDTTEVVNHERLNVS